MAAVVSWEEFRRVEPELAAFGESRLGVGPAYLATLRKSGAPRVHPVTAIIGGGRLFVFMEPTSPKGRDLRERGWYALHNGVPDINGTGGEFSVSGSAAYVDDAASRLVATSAARYEPADRYVLFELGIAEARCNGYGDVALPSRRHWVADPD
jgi:hypothetical protein